MQHGGVNCNDVACLYLCNCIVSWKSQIFQQKTLEEGITTVDFTHGFPFSLPLSGYLSPFIFLWKMLSILFAKTSIIMAFHYDNSQYDSNQAWQMIKSYRLTLKCNLHQVIILEARTS